MHDSSVPCTIRYTYPSTEIKTKVFLYQNRQQWICNLIHRNTKRRSFAVTVFSWRHLRNSEGFWILTIEPWLNFRFCPCTGGWLSLGGTYDGSSPSLCYNGGRPLSGSESSSSVDELLAKICWSSELRSTSSTHFERAESWDLGLNESSGCDQIPVIDTNESKRAYKTEISRNSTAVFKQPLILAHDFSRAGPCKMVRRFS